MADKEIITVEGGLQLKDFIDCGCCADRFVRSFPDVKRTRHPKHLGKTFRYAIRAASPALKDVGFELGGGEVNPLPVGRRIGDSAFGCQ